MMKLFQLIGICFMFSIYTSKAVDIPIDFETGTVDITNFDGGVLTVIDNGQSSGINTSAKVAQMVKNAGETWGGAYITLDNNIDFSTGKIFKMKVYAPKVGTKVLLKVQNASDETILFEKEVSTTLANQWEELSFNFSGVDDSQAYRQVVVIFENGTVGDGSANFTYLLDDITLEKGEGPLVSAPTPPVYDDLKVVSIFSDAYTSIDGINFNPYWQQKTVGSIEQIDGADVLKLSDLNYQGVELPEAVNVADMKYLHIDVWTADETLLEIYPISQTTGEKKATLTPLVQNEWNSYDITLSDLTSSQYNLADLHQLKFIGAGGHTVYIDNIYFYDDNASADVEAPTEFSVELSTVTYNSIKLLLSATDNSGAVNYTITVGGNETQIGAASGVTKAYEFTRLPSSTEFTFSISAKDRAGNAAANNNIEVVATTDVAFPEPTESSPTPPELASTDVVSIFSDSYTNVANTNFNPYWQQATWFTSVQVGGNEVLKYENFNYQGIEFGSAVDASGLDFLHIDIWSPNEKSLSISPISSSTGEKAYNLGSFAKNEWVSYDIALSAYTSQGMSVADIVHLKLVGSGKSIIYIDNIYFYAGATSNDKNNMATEDVTVYPNPVNDILVVNCETEMQSIAIYDITGQMLMSMHVNETSTLVDVSDFEAGSYVVVVTRGDGTLSTERMIKR